MKKRLGGDIPEEYSIPEVHMGEDVPKWTELLPRVHCEVPWDLGYYHVKVRRLIASYLQRNANFESGSPIILLQTHSSQLLLPPSTA